jgi:hypothetical protein
MPHRPQGLLKLEWTMNRMSIFLGFSVTSVATVFLLEFGPAETRDAVVGGRLWAVHFIVGREAVFLVGILYQIAGLFRQRAHSISLASHACGGPVRGCGPASRPPRTAARPARPPPALCELPDPTDRPTAQKGRTGWHRNRCAPKGLSALPAADTSRLGFGESWREGPTGHKGATGSRRCRKGARAHLKDLGRHTR